MGVVVNSYCSMHELRFKCSTFAHSSLNCQYFTIHFIPFSCSIWTVGRKRLVLEDPALVVDQLLLCL
jgi:hypothetical protein